MEINQRLADVIMKTGQKQCCPTCNTILFYGSLEKGVQLFFCKSCGNEVILNVNGETKERWDRSGRALSSVFKK